MWSRAGFDRSVPRLLGPDVRTASVAVLLACAAVAIADVLYRWHPGEVVEIGLLLALFATVRPFAACGVYLGPGTRCATRRGESLPTRATPTT